VLTPSEKRLLRHLSVFRGGFRRDAAQTVAGATLQDLAGLVAKSLVNSQGNDRYDMHQLVRHFAAEELEAAGETASARDRHAVWYIELAASSEDALHGPQQVQWLQRLDADLQNFETALRWITGSGSTIAPGEGWRMISALWWFCFVRGYWNNLHTWLLYFYHQDPPTDPAVRAIAIGRTGNLAWLRGDTQTAERLVAESKAAAIDSENEIAIAMAWYAEGQVYSQSDPPRARAAYAESLAITKRKGRKWGEGRSLFRMGSSAMSDNDLDLAQHYFDEALVIFRQLGDTWGIYAVLSGAADLLLRRGKPEQVKIIVQESLAHARSLGFRQGIALEVLSLGIGAWQQGQFEEARDWFEEARRLFAEIDNQRGVAQAELQLGQTSLWEGDFAEARKHFTHANDTMSALGLEPTRAGAQLGLAMLASSEGDQASARTLLSGAAFLQGQTPGLRHVFTTIFEAGARIAALSHDFPRAAVLLGATEQARRILANALAPIEVPRHQEIVQMTRAALGEEQYAMLFEEGKTKSVEQAIALL
jgi:tetratricopeptide (TPR) repeat protein